MGHTTQLTTNLSLVKAEIVGLQYEFLGSSASDSIPFDEHGNLNPLVSPNCLAYSGPVAVRSRWRIVK